MAKRLSRVGHTTAFLNIDCLTALQLCLSLLFPTFTYSIQRTLSTGPNICHSRCTRLLRHRCYCYNSQFRSAKTHMRHQDILPPITLRTPRAIVYNYFLRMLDPLSGSVYIICSFENGQGRPQTSLRSMFRQMSFELLQGYDILFYHQLKSDAVVQRGDRAPVPIFASSVAALFYVCTLELFSCFDCTLP
jgi:hypothetical protein